ncbi:protein-L-isoaspartate O-methyltransferase [Candidatus Woesearchaeota archaeon CG_4_10_14_0_8_um_filter_47_5]|nr:MAG: protein-L-isoaspartate O-methyltransferase [Candidatus Woesearchaeota archaeon CG_4_10_14_0_8_um_filter_47_5]
MKRKNTKNTEVNTDRDRGRDRETDKNSDRDTKPNREKEALISSWQSRGIITDQRIIDAFRAIPREHFMSKHYKEYAYDDTAYPLFSGSTISQPTTVLLMTQWLKPEKGQKILEIGTGSGYQAALLSLLVGPRGTIFTAEIIPELARYAREKIKALGLSNITLLQADAGTGYESRAPYDRIIITAACPKIPSPLIDQLKTGGILVAPVGEIGIQTMMRLTKRKEGYTKEHLGSFAFVPMSGVHGFT